ncbi:MAG: DUF488 domain-containing protein [Desulfobacteraceae bacterium]|nr:MAG: DUF488 domain-containing protein [Desulfobacteraceae bacterium]
MPTLFTIGHSTRSIEEFLALLKEHRIQTVADIRSFPGSRKFPHFGKDKLETLLREEYVDYEWHKNLGGFRKKQGVESPNAGLSSPGFRNYADYMATEPFRAAAMKLLQTAEKTRTAVMCAERLFWKCHRRILSDYLVTFDVDVIHILESGKIQAHALTQGAVRTSDGVTYPDPERSPSR